MTELAVYTSPLPFSTSNHKIVVTEGLTLEKIVEVAIQRRFSDCAIIAFVNGEPIAANLWQDTIPICGQIVNIKVVPQGGGGKKNPLATIITIAALVAAPYLASAYAVSAAATIAGTVGPVTAAQVATASFLIKGAVTLTGMLLSSALAPPPKQSNNARASQEAERRSQFIEGASNEFTPYGVVPINLGKNRVFPPQAIRPYTEPSGKDNYVRQMFLWGFGDKILIQDQKIGDTPLSEFRDITLSHKLSGNLHTGTSLYSNDVYQEDYNVLLEQTTGYIIRTTRPHIDEVSIDITFPNGLTEFNRTSGAKMKRTVQLELQYAPTGTSDWSPAVNSFSAVSNKVLATTAPVVAFAGRRTSTVGYRKDAIVINNFTKVVSIINGEHSLFTQEDAKNYQVIIPQYHIKLGYIITKVDIAVAGYSIVEYATEKSSSLIGKVIQNSSDFTIGTSGTSVTVSSGGIAVDQLTFYEATSEALRRAVNIRFPTNGTYDIRIKRITADSSTQEILDKAYLTAIKSITHVNPWALEDCNGTAIRIRANDQLNGSINQYNAVISSVIPDYDSVSGTWINAETSNPASLYLYVLTGLGNAKPLNSNQYILEDLEEWHTYCEEKGYTYNKFINYEATIDDILADIASAGSASPDIRDGKRTIVIDKPKTDIVTVITPRNSWGYSGRIITLDLPHAVKVQFRNASKNYVVDERIIPLDGYTESTATKFETIEAMFCVDADLAYQLGRLWIFKAIMRSEQHVVYQDFENLQCTRGDRVLFAHDVPIITVGDARIKSLSMDGSDLIGMELDDFISVPNNSTYYIRIRKGDGTTLYKEIITSIGETKTIVLAQPLSTGLPEVGDLCYVVETGGELDCIVKRIEPSADLSARIYLDNYAPEIFDEELRTPPPFNSNITTPLEFIRPSAPILINYQSGEDVMILNSDGSYLSRAIITLNNLNDGEIIPLINIRVSGTDSFQQANILKASPEEIILTGLEDGTRYDIHIRYKRLGGNVFSPPLELNNYEFVGASEVPADVENFKATIIDNNITLDWSVSEEIDHSHHKMKYSALYTGTSWNTAQLIVEKIYTNRITLPFLPGTYLIKDVDRLGNESENATTVITYNPGQISNVVETLTEHSAFSGTKDNVSVNVDGLFLTDPTLGEGYYYFNSGVDLGAVYTSIVKSSIVANAINVNDVFDMTDVMVETDMFAASDNDVFSMTDVMVETDIFGIDNALWSVELQYRTKQSSGGSWTDWVEFSAGSYQFYAIEPRLKLISLSGSISPLVSFLQVVVDMPDRFERAENITVTAAGYTVTYPTAFKNNPSVAILLQDGAVDDKIEFTLKTASGFTFKVYNQTISGYVTRSFDYISAGYGRVQ